MSYADKSDIWIPIYIGDLLADTTHLSRADFGSYLLLIFLYWRRRRPLPDDDKALSEAARVALRDWPPVRKMLAEFFQIGDGVWRQKRIDAELDRTKSVRKAKSRAGKRGAAARWANGEGNGKRMADEMAKDMTKNGQSQSQSQSKNKYTDIHIHTAEPAKALHDQSSARRLHGIPAIAYGQTLKPKVSEEQCRAFWAHYEGQARTNASGDLFWVTSSDAVITNWKAKLPQFRPIQHETNRRTHKENPRNAGMPSPPDGGQGYAKAFQRRSQQGGETNERE